MKLLAINVYKIGDKLVEVDYYHGRRRDEGNNRRYDLSSEIKDKGELKLVYLLSANE